MSSNKFTPKSEPIRFDSSSAFIPEGLSRDEWVAIVPRMEMARRAVMAELDERRSSGGAGQGRGAGGIDLPERALAEYRRQRRTSELGRILAAAKGMRETVDRVVIVGSEVDCAAPRALFDACCHPYHNELGRGDRGGRPRIYFAGDNLDNDALQGLLDLLPHERPATTIDEHWGIISIGSGPTKDGNAEGAENAEKTTANDVFQVLFAALVRSCGGDSEAATRHVETCRALPDGRTLASDSRRPTSVFSVAGLLPGSVMGLDVVRLLEGGAAMSERFRAAPIGDNPPLDFAGVLRLMVESRGAVKPRFVTWGRGLATAASVFEELLGDRTASLESQISNLKSENSNLKYQMPEMPVNLIAESVRRDRIAIGVSSSGNGPATLRAEQTLPDLQAAEIEAAKAAAIAAGCPSVDIRLPALDESSIGQLFQMLTLSLRVLSVLRG
jgi:glucose-6-phosphate isomerase